MSAHDKLGAIYRVLTAGAMILIAIAYISPIWWVSLTAPQYPETAFPQGIRIHFHMDGVFNGCKLVESAERYEEEALNCKHEMDAINHYVGMYPIAAGGPVERSYSPFLFSLLGLMLVTFMIPGKKARVGVFAAGSIAIAVWMWAAMHGTGGMKLLSPNYVYDVTTTMDLEPEDYAEWSGLESVRESYLEALGRYFRDMAKINPQVDLMMSWAHAVFWIVLAGMAALTVGMLILPPVYWLMALIPAALPVFFIVEYAAWLWWFGHSLSDMAAFSVKPFMPTVLGQGKVAQFSTFSYPHYGFGLIVAASALLLLAMLIRRKQIKEDS